MMRERYKPEDLNEARLRMARIPEGADLIDNPISRAPGFRIGNVIVMAGVPTIMQAMLDNVAPTLATGARMIIETIAAGGVPEGLYAAGLGEVAKAHPARLDRLLSGLHGERLRQPDRRARQGPLGRRRSLGRGARARSAGFSRRPSPPDH